MERALSLLAAILLVRFVASEALYQKARRVGNEVRFPAGVVLRVVLGTGAPLGLYGAYEAVKVARQSGEWWLPAICLGFVLLALAGDPGEIRVKPSGIELRRLFGFTSRHVEWDGASARHIAGLREVLVVGKDGVVITHSQYHVDQERFLFELRRHGIAT